MTKLNVAKQNVYFYHLSFSYLIPLFLHYLDNVDNYWQNFTTYEAFFFCQMIFRTSDQTAKKTEKTEIIAKCLSNYHLCTRKGTLIVTLSKNIIPDGSLFCPTLKITCLYVESLNAYVVYKFLINFL